MLVFPNKVGYKVTSPAISPGQYRIRLVNEVLFLQRIKKEILQADTPPRITAISMAVGVALAFGPLPGLHLLLGFLLNRIFKLNAVIMLVGILIHNP